MELWDAITLDKATTRVTADGYMVSVAKVARTGIQEYLGSEVGRPDLHVVKVYRPEDSVFDEASMATLAHRPVTIDHPPVAVTAENWGQYARGFVAGKVARVGDHIEVPLTLMDAAAIRSVESGKRELSCGYTCDLEWGDGVTPDGLPFNAKQVNIRFNHLSVVDKARGGPDLRIGDDMPAELKKITVDGIPVETTDAGATVIETLQRRITDAATDAAKLATDHAAAISAKDAKIATLDAKVATLEAAQVTDADLDKRVADRQKLISDAKRIGGDTLDVTGSNADIKKRAVLAKLGDSYKDRDAAFMDAAFELQLVSAPNNDVRGVVRDMQTVSTTDASAAHKAMLDRTANAWQGNTKGNA